MLDFLTLSQLGAIAAILQLFVTGYLSYRVYKLTQQLLELEEHDQQPGKITVTAVDKKELDEDRYSFTFRIKNIGEGRTEIAKVDMPIMEMDGGEVIKANGTSTPAEYTTPLVLDPGESYEVSAQFREIDGSKIKSVGLTVFTENHPEGFLQMTDSGAGNF